MPSLYLNQADLFSIGPLGTNIPELKINIQYIFIQENEIEIIVYKMAAILSETQCLWYYSFLGVCIWAAYAISVLKNW